MKEPRSARTKLFRKGLPFYVVNNRKAWDTSVYRELNCVCVWVQGGKSKEEY